MSSYFTCRRQTVGDGHVWSTCDRKHRTLAAAESCIHRGQMRPGIFKEFVGEIVEIPDEGRRRIVRRYASVEHVSDAKGGGFSMRGGWAVLP